MKGRKLSNDKLCIQKTYKILHSSHKESNFVLPAEHEQCLSQQDRVLQ